MRIKQVIKRYLPRKIFYFLKEILYPEKVDVLENRLNSLFLTHYKNIGAPNISQKIAIRDAEFKIYSKHGGDGILAYIFSKIGATNHTFIEMGVEDGRECNTSNLSFNLGWKGLLIDANEDWIKSARAFYKEKLGSNADNIKMTANFVTAENINQLITDSGFRGEIDLLSIDIDSNDYWVWKSINVINPRVVVMEYNAAMSNESVTIKYDPDFHYKGTSQKYPLYFGASLKALVKLGKEKGYILVGCDTHGHDAFFVRSDVAEGKFVELSSEEAFYPNPYTLKKFGSVEEQFKQIRHLDLIQI
ncbi:hypothetical protein HOE22_02450 [Candidatus Woesearchaeota archaeon]|jgi:hypothetical protein|nr:hypothetical protein [Candidatus Woesearchaeota archaeon]MBT6048123.1 hypothetical protein [Candidatus Scalindua sp.]